MIDYDCAVKGRDRAVRPDPLRCFRETTVSEPAGAGPGVAAAVRVGTAYLNGGPGSLLDTDVQHGGALPKIECDNGITVCGYHLAGGVRQFLNP